MRFISSLRLKIFSVVIILIVGAILFFYFRFKPASRPQFGITFSHTYAASLGFDSQQVYLDMLEDLKPKKIRLMTYWNEIEKERVKFDFSRIDQMLTEAEKRGVEVILVVGQKQPRWPECHYPNWYKDLSLDEKDSALANMLEKTIEHFRTFSAIKYWQVENEPFFVFGIDCPKQTRESLSKEISIVRSKDSRPIILTESGEQGNWNYAAGSGADLLGVTMYRLVYNDKLGYYRYPIGPWYYRIKAGFLQQFHKDTPVIGIELQAEPWLLAGIFNTDLETQKTLMNPNIFEEHINYASKVGLVDNYLWGVEWWYWMAKRNNDWGMWAKAKELLNN